MRRAESTTFGVKFPPFFLLCTIKVYFSAREKIMLIGQNGPLEKFMRFLFMRLNVACITNIIILCRDNIYADTNLCDCRLTRIIRINKTRAEKCRFTVFIVVNFKQLIIITSMFNVTIMG